MNDSFADSARISTRARFLHFWNMGQRLPNVVAAAGDDSLKVEEAHTRQGRTLRFQQDRQQSRADGQSDVISLHVRLRGFRWTRLPPIG